VLGSFQAREPLFAPVVELAVLLFSCKSGGGRPSRRNFFLRISVGVID